MDRATDLTDAFVELRFKEDEVYRTSIARRTLNPVWDEDIRFEVLNDADLQNEPLELKVMDYDQITYNDAIGTVYIDLNPLLSWDSNNSISGWFPIFDTLRGVRGEINVQVKISFFGDINPFKDGSPNVQFFTLPCLPAKYHVAAFLGFVTALDTESDPEYHWSDNFRTPRTSNDQRTRVMFRLSGHLRRQLGKKVIDMGGNAVLGYQQYFSLEGEVKSITAHAIGTAVKLVIPSDDADKTGLIGTSFHSLTSQPPHAQTASSSSNALDTQTPSPAVRPLSTSTPVVHPSGTRTPNDSPMHFISSPPTPLDQQSALPLPTPPPLMTSTYSSMILTINQLPSQWTHSIAGLVSATSVKIIDSDDREVRESWWTELRDEIRSHARALNCNVIMGYHESCSILDEIAVLHSYGTAIVMDFTSWMTTARETSAGPEGGDDDTSSGDDASVRSEGPAEEGAVKVATTPPQFSRIGSNHFGAMLSSSYTSNVRSESVMKRKTSLRNPCSVCHISFDHREPPFPMNFVKCARCKKKYVPEILLSTAEPPADIETVGKGLLIEAHVCRPKRFRIGEHPATVVSESLPFAQYDIHRQLTYKLRVYGLNAIFGLKIHFTVGESMFTAVASGTALYVRALPPPTPLKVLRNLSVLDEEDARLLELQKKMMAVSEMNRKAIEAALGDEGGTTNGEDGDDEDEDGSEGESEIEDDAVGGKGAGGGVDMTQRNVVVHIDDEHDEDLVLLMDPEWPESFQLCTIELPASKYAEELAKVAGERGAGLPPLPYTIAGGSMSSSRRESMSEADTNVPEKRLYSSLVSTWSTQHQQQQQQQQQRAVHKQMISLVKHGNITSLTHHPNRQLATILKELYMELLAHVGYYSSAVVAGINYEVQLPKEGEVQVRLTAVAVGTIGEKGILDTKASLGSSMEALDLDELSSILGGRNSINERGSMAGGGGIMGSSGLTPSPLYAPGGGLSDRLNFWSGNMKLSWSPIVTPVAAQIRNITRLSMLGGGSSAASNAGAINTPSERSSSSIEDDMVFDIDEDESAAIAAAAAADGSTPAPRKLVRQSTYSKRSVAARTTEALRLRPQDVHVEITPLSFVPGARIDRILGRLSLHFVKEANIVYEAGVGLAGMGGFSHGFLTELYAIARAHAAALGGNAVLCFTIDQSLFSESIKNQGYALLCVSGDVAEVDGIAGAQVQSVEGVLSGTGKGNKKVVA